MILTGTSPIPQDEEVGIRLLRIRRNENKNLYENIRQRGNDGCCSGGIGTTNDNTGCRRHKYPHVDETSHGPVLLNPWYPHHQHAFDVHNDENYRRRKMEKLHHDLHYLPPPHYNYRPSVHPVPPPMQYFTSGKIPVMQQEPPPPRLLRPEGKRKLRRLIQQQQQDTKSSRHQLLLDPFHPVNNNVVACSEDIKEDLKKKHKKIIKLKKYDSNDNSITEDLSIQLLKTNYPMYNIANNMLFQYGEEVQENCTEVSCSTESSNATAVVDKSIQINSTIIEECTQTEQHVVLRSNVSNLGTQTSPEEQKKVQLKGEQLLDVLRHSHIMDLETYFQLMEKQEREGTSNSALDISILNNTEHFPEVPHALAPSNQNKGIADSRDLPNVSNIHHASVDSSTESKPTSTIPQTKSTPSSVEITYALEDYMSPVQVVDNIRNNMQQEKPILTTSTTTPSKPQAHNDPPTDIKPISTLTRSNSKSQITDQHLSRQGCNNANSELGDQPFTIIKNTSEDPQNIVSIPNVETTPSDNNIVSKDAPLLSSCNEDDEPKPPKFEERIIYLEEEKSQPSLNSQSYPTYTPAYMDKVIYIDELRKEKHPTCSDRIEQAEEETSYSSVEIPYFEERILELGKQPTLTNLNEQTHVDDDNVSITTIGSQETYEEYLQRIGIDITNMPFSSEAVKKKLELQMAISARNSLNFTRGSLLMPQDFDFGNQSFLSTLNNNFASSLRHSKAIPNGKEEDQKTSSVHQAACNREEQNTTRANTQDKNIKPNPPTVESILRNILENSNKIKSKLNKCNEEASANNSPALINQKNIHIEEITEYKSRISKLEKEFMSNADYLIAQTELMKEETEEALGRIDRLQLIKKERFNESLDVVYHQKR
nr:unnamed protein product [Naegleria fowleri]